MSQSKEPRIEPAPARQDVEPQKADDEIFSLEAAASSEAVKKYRPRYVGKGSEQIVYEIPGRPEVVVKVSAEIMAGIQKHNGPPYDELKPEIAAPLETMLRDKRRRQDVLREYYGPQHALPTKQYLLKVPVTPEIIRAIHENDPPPGAEVVPEAWAFVSIQGRAKEFNNPEHLSITSSYLEHRTRDRAAYERLTAALAEGAPDAEIDWDEYLRLFGWQKELFDKIDEDPGLREMMADFVRRTQAYAQATGEILDLGGDNNVTVYHEDGKWNYHLVDALYPSMTRARQFEIARGAVEKLLRDEPLDQGERSDLLNALNFTRTVNALAVKTGIKERLKLLPDGATAKLDLLGFFRS